jgi:hypothetical protein
MRSQINLFCAAPATVPVNRTSVQKGGYTRDCLGLPYPARHAPPVRGSHPREELR